MKLAVKVIPGAQKNCTKQEGKLLKVYLTAPAVEGKANKALMEFLAKHFHVRKRNIDIIKGLKSRNKIIKIEDI